ncbi:MAG: biopolymer transporter ExbB [Myxococcales bacterium]|nr:biopolymer transporter ExbB [Myxococcales bacterium]
MIASALLGGCGRLGFEPAHVAGDGLTGDWWDLGFARRNRIDVLGSKLASSATDFPLLVHLAPPAFDLAAMKLNGGDLRFVAADQLTPLAYEIETVTPAGVDVWVRVPEIQVVDEVIWAYYGNPSAPPGPSGELVWAPEVVGAWHLGANGRDSTSHHLDGAFAGTIAVPGISGDAREMQTGGYFEVSPASALAAIGANGTATWSIWLWPHSHPAPARTMTVMGRQTDAGGLNDFRFGTSSGGTSGQISVDPGSVDVGVSGGQDVLERWQLLALVRDGSELRLTVDGVTRGSTTMIGTIHVSQNRVLMGADCNSCAVPNDDYVDGILDEARIESVARTDDWLTAEVLDANGQLDVVEPFEQH